MKFKNCRFKWIFVLIAGLVMLTTTVGYAGANREGRPRFREILKERRAARAQTPQQDPRCAEIIPPITQGYGADGQYTVKKSNIRNPKWGRRPVTVFYPAENTGPYPVIFHSHGYGGVDYKHTLPLINHIVSRGFVFVYSPYKTMVVPDKDQPYAQFSERYDILWSGFKAAVKEYGHLMDLDKAGFTGHSFGGGATPAMAYRGFVQEGWGKKAAFMLPMAPWYSFEMDNEKFNAFPAHTKFLVQVYADDEINDHRMAIDMFKSMGIRESEKDFVVFYSGSVDGCEFSAAHNVPARGPTGPLKYYGVFRLFDALADYAITGSQEAKNIALGHGSREQTFMGRRPDGREFPRLQSMSNPKPLKSEGFYKYPWRFKHNQRVNAQSF